MGALPPATPSYNWDDLRFLLAVYKSGTMSAAARELGTNVATVSRRIDRLATELGGNPFVKTPAGWRPKPSIAGLLDAASTFDGQMRQQGGARPSARLSLPRLRMGVPPLIANSILLPALGARGSPIDRVDLEVVHRMFETGLGGHDAVIQPNRPKPTPTQSGMHVGTLAFGVYRWRSAPETNRWIGLVEAHEPFEPIERAGAIFRRGPCIRLESFDMVFQASRALRLPAPLPEILARSEPGLVRVDRGPALVPVEFWLVHHASRRGDPALQILSDWVESAFALVTGPMARAAEG